jgi:DNA-binding transcriptional MerR regulator
VDHPTRLTVEELAQRERTSASTIRYWQWKGIGPKSIKVGRRRLFELADVEAWEAQHRTEGPDAA